MNKEGLTGSLPPLDLPSEGAHYQMHHIPLSVNPNGRMATRVALILSKLAAAILTTQLYTRAFLLRTFGLVDGLMAFGALIAAPQLFLLFIQVKEFGIDLPKELGDPATIPTLQKFKLHWANSSQQYLGSYSSILIIYRIGRLYMALAYDGTFEEILKCPGKEMHRALISIYILTDFLVLLIPFPLVWKLKIDTKKRAMLLAVFGMGLTTCSIASVMKTIVTDKAMESGEMWSYKPHIWENTEIDLTTICGSLPPLKSFIDYLHGRKIGSQSHQSRNSSNMNSNSRNTGNSKGTKIALSPPMNTNSNWDERAAAIAIHKSKFQMVRRKNIYKRGTDLKPTALKLRRIYE
ncbi:hypothetical protein DFH27DRAFT_651628 [Peziza echinospora]|nr:hypothetical protein DFH27DRAFT_651628 [Peziza echinospora]